MSTTIRPELSEKNPYYINKHRYYELKHFCLQYPIWVKAIKECPISTNRIDILNNSQIEYKNPILETIERNEWYSRSIEMLQLAAKQASEDLFIYIFKAVTEERSYTYLRTVLGIPCCKETYYECYRRFFWILDKLRK